MSLVAADEVPLARSFISARKTRVAAAGGVAGDAAAVDAAADDEDVMDAGAIQFALPEPSPGLPVRRNSRKVRRKEIECQSKINARYFESKMLNKLNLLTGWSR